MFIDTVGGL